MYILFTHVKIEINFKYTTLSSIASEWPFNYETTEGKVCIANLILTNLIVIKYYLIKII